MTRPLVSVIVTTRNNHDTLEACLQSIRRQTYHHIELLVVDNNSTDGTKDIAKLYTDHAYTYGPERSAQRNFGVQHSSGEYVLIIDSDMELTDEVVAACMEKVGREPIVGAVIIPEESFGEGFWAQCKRLERSFYVGVDAIEAARFFRRDLYDQVGGYNETMTGGEDWDLTRRVRAITPIGRVAPMIRHNEGHPRFTRTMRKMYYYARHSSAYFAENPTQSVLTNQSGPLERFKLFFSRPTRLLRNPVLGMGMLTLKTAEYVAGGLGYVRSMRVRGKA